MNAIIPPHQKAARLFAPQRWLAGALVAAIRFYQRFLSPALPVVTLGACACRFTPSCSHYAVDAIRTHGAFAGVWLAVRRLAKCTPLHPGGFDPVPPVSPPRSRPVCTRSTSLT